MAVEMPARYVALTEEEVDSVEFQRMRPAELKAYLIFRRLVDWNTGIAKIADSRLAARLGITSKRGARRIIRQLIKQKQLGLHVEINDDGNAYGGRGFGRRFSEYEVRDLRGEFLFTPAGNKNNPLRGRKVPSEGHDNAPSSKVSKSEVSNQVRKKEGTEPTARLGNEIVDRTSGETGGAVYDGEVAVFLDNHGVKNPKKRQLSGFASMQDCKMAWARTCLRAKAMGKKPESQIGYFIKTIEGMWEDRLKDGATAKSNGSASNGKGSANERGAPSVDHGVVAAPARPANGVSESRISAKDRESKLLADLHADIERKRAASARATGKPIGRILS